MVKLQLSVRSKTQKTAKDGESRRKTTKDGERRDSYEIKATKGNYYTVLCIKRRSIIAQTYVKRKHHFYTVSWRFVT